MGVGEGMINTKINVWWVPPSGKWCMDTFSRTLTGDFFRTAKRHEYVFRWLEEGERIPEGASGIVVVAGDSWVGREEVLNEWINAMPWCMFVLLSDEGALFDLSKLSHPNWRLWVQNPRESHRGADAFLGCGVPNQTRVALRLALNDKPRDTDWFFAGQITHSRRISAANAMESLRGTKSTFLPTDGFAKGFGLEDYVSELCSAKVVPCPSGPTTPDTFRLWEALEAGCLPIADSKSPAGGNGYWHLLFGGRPPFPIIEEWSSLSSVMENALSCYPANVNRVYSWWQQYKRNSSYRIDRDVTVLSGEQPKPTGPGSPVTVLIPTSPIPSHPSTAMIEQVIESVQAQSGLYGCEIIVMCDGVRPEQEHRRADYDEYVRRLTWLCANRWSARGNVVPMVFSDHGHQANLTRAALKMVHSPLILFMEHDTPLVTDEPIDWEACIESISAGALDVVRFHFEAFIPEVHQYLMLRDGPIDFYGAPMRLTTQWSQRPHLASTSYYRRFLKEHFPETSRTMIEDKMHSVAQREGWRKHRLAIYHPEGNIKRSLNLAGREDDPKYDMKFS